MNIYVFVEDRFWGVERDLSFNVAIGTDETIS